MAEEPLQLEDRVIAALRRITRAIDLHSKVLLNEHGLTAPQLAALQSIGRMQPVSVGALAKSIHLSQATLTGVVSRLEKRGLLTRNRDHGDRRSVVVALTEEGRKLLESAPSLLHDRFRCKLHELEEWEQTQMLATLQRIASMMDATDIVAVPMLAPGDVAATPEDVSTFLRKALDLAGNQASDSR